MTAPAHRIGFARNLSRKPPYFKGFKIKPLRCADDSQLAMTKFIMTLNKRHDLWRWIWGITLLLPCPVALFYSNYLYRHAIRPSGEFYWRQIVVCFVLGVFALFGSRLRLRTKIVLIPFAFVIQWFASYLGQILSFFAPWGVTLG